MNRYNIGIMQGRLTVSRGRGIQFFPFDNWQEEFKIASSLGLSEIEFIFDYEDYERNPLWNQETAIENVMNKTGIKVNAVCFDYFMRRPFFKFYGNQKKYVREENYLILKQVIKNMKALDIGLLEIPLVDNSSLSSDIEAEEFRAFLDKILKDTNENIHFGLETDLPPYKFRDYIDSFQTNMVGANYDSGNSSGLGYDSYEEIKVLGNRILNIHIKDRIYHGATVPLGTGSADFDAMFKALSETDYKGSFILQAARKQDGMEQETVREQIDFVRGYVKIIN